MTLSHTEREKRRGERWHKGSLAERRDERGSLFRKEEEEERAFQVQRGRREFAKNISMPRGGGEREKYEVSNAEPALKSSRHFFI